MQGSCNLYVNFSGQLLYIRNKKIHSVSFYLSKKVSGFIIDMNFT